MHIRYLTDAQGQPTDVVIPIHEWEEVSRFFEYADDVPPEEVEEALQALVEYRENTDIAVPIEEVIDELLHRRAD